MTKDERELLLKLAAWAEWHDGMGHGEKEMSAKLINRIHFLSYDISIPPIPEPEPEPDED